MTNITLLLAASEDSFEKTNSEDLATPYGKTAPAWVGDILPQPKPQAYALVHT